MNFYKRYLGDYARDTAHLSLMEHGAYQVLLDTYYATDGKLPTDSEELYRIARAMNPAERKAVDRVVGQFFVVNGDGTRHNKRADEELNAYLTQAETNRRIAVEREAKRKEHEPSHEPCSDRATNEQPKPEARSQKRVPRTRGAPKTRMPEGFAISDRVRTWAAGKGFTDLERHFEAFVSKAIAKGYTYADWDEGFMGAIRDNWANLETPSLFRKVAAG